MILHDLLPFFSGAVTMGYALAGLFFLRFWHRSRDRLFLAFAGAFWLLTLQTMSAIIDISDEPRSWIFVLRLAAFLLIIAAVVAKNRHRMRRSG
jgi:hypothetical protein